MLMRDDQNQQKAGIIDDPRGVGWHYPPAPHSEQPPRSFWSRFWGIITHSGHTSRWPIIVVHTRIGERKP